MDNDISELNGDNLVKSTINDMNVIEHIAGVLVSFVIMIEIAYRIHTHHKIHPCHLSICPSTIFLVTK